MAEGYWDCGPQSLKCYSDGADEVIDCTLFVSNKRRHVIPAYLSTPIRPTHRHGNPSQCSDEYAFVVMETCLP